MSAENSWLPRRAAEQELRHIDRDLATWVTDAALFSRACLLDNLGHTECARNAYLDVLARDAGHLGALANLGALLFASGYTSAARTVYIQAVEAHPDDPAAHVNLANLLRLANQPDSAQIHYDAALQLDPGCPAAHQGLSYLLDGIDEAAAERHRTLGFADRYFTTSVYRGEAPPTTVLQLVSARGGNIPTARILDDRMCLTHTLVSEFADPRLRLPPHDLVFNAIGDADRCSAALAAAARLLAHTTAPVLNPPDRVLPTTRLGNARRLSRLPGVVVPKTMRISRDLCALKAPRGIGMPLLLRSLGYHTGHHFRRINEAAELPAAIAALPGDPLLAIEYLDATGADGASRKYRAMFIGREILPLHLAISGDWKVHYFTSEMRDNAAYREEEARFLENMPAVLGPAAMAALTSIRDALGLDYGGVDFALTPDRRLMLFEANATMTLAPPASGQIWDYRRPAFNRALASVHSLIRRAAPKGLQFMEITDRP